jgi:hypothetical protein
VGTEESIKLKVKMFFESSEFRLQAATRKVESAHKLLSRGKNVGGLIGYAKSQAGAGTGFGQTDNGGGIEP